MKVLVIGGTGLISTAIILFLMERGDDVTLCSRGIRYSRTTAIYCVVLSPID